MKINNPKKKSSKTIWIVVIALVTVAAIGLVTYALFSPMQSSNEGDAARPTASNTGEGVSGDNETTADTPLSSPAEHEAEKNISPSYEGTDPNTSQSLTGVINRASVADGTLTIRTTINQSLTSGSCRLTLTNGQKTVTRNVNITPNPSSSTCEGFDVPTSELGSGSWDINITISSGDRTGSLKGGVNI